MAQLTDNSESLVILVGSILPPETSDRPEMIQVLVSNNRVVKAPVELAEFLDFICTPQLESEALALMISAGGTAEDFKNLISSGRLCKVSGKTAAGRLKDLKGLQLVPLGYPVRISEEEGDSIVWVGASEDATMLMSINGLTATAMWETKDGEDLPATGTRLQRTNSKLYEDVAHKIISDIDTLLINKLARLEKVNAVQKSKSTPSILQRLLFWKNK